MPVRPRLVLASLDPLELMNDVIIHQGEGWRLSEIWVRERGWWLWRTVVYFAALTAVDQPAPEPDGLEFVVGPVREQRS